MVAAPSESFMFEWIQENVKIHGDGAENLVGIYYGHFFTSVAFNETSPFSAFFLSSIKSLGHKNVLEWMIQFGVSIMPLCK